MMKFHTLRQGEVASLSEKHPVIAQGQPNLANPILPPLNTDDPDFPILFYAEEDGELACHFKSFPDVLMTGGERVPFAWNGNLMTMPKFRRRGLAQAIVERQVEEFDRLSVVWGGVFSSFGALHLYNKLSFTMLGAAPRLCLVRNISPILSYHVPKVVARPLSGLMGIGSKVRDLVLRGRQPYRGNVVSKKIGPEEFSGIHASRFHHHPQQAYWDTDANWLLSRRNVRDVDEIFLVYLDEGQDPKGYILLRQRVNLERPIREKYFNMNTMTLMHYGEFEIGENTLEILLAAAIDRFWSSGADMFEVVTACPSMQNAARRAGMFPLGAGMSFKFREPAALKGKLPRELSAYKLTHYAGDAFSFE